MYEIYQHEIIEFLTFFWPWTYFYVSNVLLAESYAFYLKLSLTWGPVLIHMYSDTGSRERGAVPAGAGRRPECASTLRGHLAPFRRWNRKYPHRGVTPSERRQVCLLLFSMSGVKFLPHLTFLQWLCSGCRIMNMYKLLIIYLWVEQ
jgi:hypothetical protein